MNSKGESEPAERRQARKQRAQLSAFTLLEVILALGILAASLAIVGEVTRLAYRNSERAAMEGEALIIAESVMSQLLAGLIDPVDIPATEWIIGSQPATWRYSLSIEPTDLEELLTVRVRVEQVTDESSPIAVQLVRWVLDPAEIEESSTSEGA